MSTSLKSSRRARFWNPSLPQGYGLIIGGNYQQTNLQDRQQPERWFEPVKFPEVIKLQLL